MFVCFVAPEAPSTSGTAKVSDPAESIADPSADGTFIAIVATNTTANNMELGDLAHFPSKCPKRAAVVSVARIT